MSPYLILFSLSALLAMLYELRLVRLARGSYGLALIVLALFAGLRYEVGQDWPAYEEYFEDIEQSESRFEIGYYLLNYSIKLLGGTYSAVFLIAALFLSFTIYRLTARYRLDRFYILTIYIGYSFLILNFAQVRQSIAVSFILLGVDSYLRHGKRLRAFSIAAFAPLFQISAVMYLALILLAWVWESLSKSGARLRVLVALLGTITFVGVAFIDPYPLLSAVVFSTSAREKLEVYNSVQEGGTTALWLFAAYLGIIALYIYAHRDTFTAKLAVLSLFMSISLSINIQSNDPKVCCK